MPSGEHSKDSTKERREPPPPFKKRKQTAKCPLPRRVKAERDSLALWVDALLFWVINQEPDIFLAGNMNSGLPRYKANVRALRFLPGREREREVQPGGVGSPSDSCPQSHFSAAPAPAPAGTWAPK